MFNKIQPVHLLLTLLFLALCLVACSDKDDDSTGPEPDTTPPAVVSVTPAGGAINVPVDVVIQAVFSETIDTTTVTSSTFAVDTGVTGIFSFSGDTVTLTPSNLLAYSTVYTATITTGVTDPAGNGLDSNYSWSFNTTFDPATLPPVVISTVPANGAVDVATDAQISATFSKGMDPASLTPATFTLDKGITGTVTYADKTAVFTPNETLTYDSTYTATISTTVADTFGYSLSGDYDWSFTIVTDPMKPVVSVAWPFDGAIVGDSVTIRVDALHPVGVDKVEFFIDGSHIVSGDDTSEPFEHIWDASGSAIAGEHFIYARAYDSSGRMGVSDTVVVFYQWEELVADINDPWLTDLRRVFARSTDTLLEFRYECWEPWFDPYDTVLDDTTLDLGIYLDTDRNRFTGRTDFAGSILNDIGAEFRIIIGIHGSEALAFWNEQSEYWQLVYDPEGFAYLDWPPDTNILEFGIRWIDLLNPDAVNIISINVFFLTPTVFHADWMPDEGDGHITIRRENRYIGEGYSAVRRMNDRYPRRQSAGIANPFDSK